MCTCVRVCVCVVNEYVCVRVCGCECTYKCVGVCNDVVSLSERVLGVSECGRVVSCVYGKFKLNFKLGNKLNLLSIFFSP